MNFFKYIFFILAIFHSSIALSNDEIYYLDMNYLMNNSLAAKSIISQLEKKNKINSTNFKKIEDDLKNEEKKIISQKNILKNEEYQKKVNLFSEKVNDYKKKSRMAAEDINNSKIVAQKELVVILTGILSEYSKKNSIKYIISKESIIIGKSDLDVTKKIFELLNVKIKKIKLK
jgi:Skp family chaperone for outer membrane proteins